MMCFSRCNSVVLPFVVLLDQILCSRAEAAYALRYPFAMRRRISDRVILTYFVLFNVFLDDILR